MFCKGEKTGGLSQWGGVRDRQSEAAEKATRTKYKKDFLAVGMKYSEIFDLMELN